jgi:uncharacterized protein
MKKHHQPLTDDELEDLEDLLLDRFGDDDETIEGRDEGIFLLDELDGFITALVSGPVAALPPVWLPMVWGDYPPIWQSSEEMDYFMGLLRRYQNEIANLLSQQPDAFEPLYSWYEMDRKRYDIVDDWCEGYMRGVRVLGSSWEDGHPKATALLEPVRAFCKETGWHGHEAETEENEALRTAIVANVRALYRYWHQPRGVVPQS